MDYSDLSTAGAQIENQLAEDDLGSADQIVYDCTAWAGESRRLLAAMLDGAEIPNVWHGTEVTVVSADTDRVDEMIEQALSTARSAIDPDAPTITYEIGEWPDALQNEFAMQLTISEVPYVWNADGDIVVNESDEDLVQEVLDLLPDEDSFDNVDGLEVQGLLNEVFMVCDRLASKPADDRALDELRRLTTTLGSISVPFGFDDGDWTRLKEAVEGASTNQEQLSDKSRAKAAKAARERVKSYI